ncbi:MAG: cbb3-type cytochrome c oxidase subunit I [Candidatus Poribacteria bacterium]|nr:cbb3-type cytochrome c oxidase subunit I [Candidatus Poribacteria bacterium]
MQENENMSHEHDDDENHDHAHDDNDTMQHTHEHDDDEHHAHAHHEESFIRKYIFSLDHKMIGKQFLIYGLIMLFVGGGLALLFRWQLAYPERPLPIIGASEKYMEDGEVVTGADKMWERIYDSDKEEWLEAHMPNGVVEPAIYNMLFTMHATIMVFFVVVPILVGAFGNFLIPLMIGTRDMAFPILNMLSFWLAVLAAVIMAAGFIVPGGHASAGWTGYAPLSVDPQWTGVGWGLNLWAISLLIQGFSSLVGSINYITTVINMRAPGMTWLRLPLVIWSLFIVAVLLLLAFPVLSSALALLIFDRLAGTTFFTSTAEGGGDPLLWQHLFWFFGHPEVYILILPGMGIASELVAVFSRKPIFGYRSMVYAMIAIAFLGWVVWGHHMFQSGMRPGMGAFFMTTTMLIAVPSAIKTFNWLGTMYRGSIRFTTPMLHALAFVSMFVIGGLSGIYMANTPVDIYIHDTYYIVAHIHYVVFGGSLFAIFGGIIFWFPKMYGRYMNDTLSKIHFWLTFIAFNCTFFPMHILGVGGHRRRISNPMAEAIDVVTQEQLFADMNIFITMSAFTLGFVQLILVFNFVWSIYRGKVAEKNPWNVNTLEWEAPTPVPHGNFAQIPTVYRGPYEYSVPGEESDFIPQAQPEHAPASAGD